MGRLFCESRNWRDIGGVLSTTIFFILPMNAHIKSYLWFVAFMAVTALVVKPVANSLNLPLVKDILG